MPCRMPAVRRKQREQIDLKGEDCCCSDFHGATLMTDMCLMKSGMTQTADFGRPLANMHAFPSLSTRGCSFLPQSHFLCEMWACTDHFSVTPTFLHGKIEEHYLGDTPEMKCSPGFVTVVLLMLGQTHGDSVTQMEGQVTLSEKAFLTVNCTYSASGYPALYWYVQYPGEGPRLLLKALRDKEKGSKKGFEANYDRDSKSFHLQKGSVRASDSAVYYCALRVRGLDVEQSPPALSLQEGASSTLKCNFSSTVNNVQWFRQNPEGGGLTRLFYVASGMKQSGRLNCTVNAKERGFFVELFTRKGLSGKKRGKKSK
ncbi:hypothetical protein GH733_004137 [Mirounga leonina]|nr:hypothetical protein GH733_004137 [Mirounga leonina]